MTVVVPSPHAQKNMPYLGKFAVVVKHEAEPNGEEDNSSSQITKYYIMLQALPS